MTNIRLDPVSGNPSGLYTLQDPTPVAEPDVQKWGEWMWREDSGHRRVALDVLDRGNVQVSTVFLGMDHQFGDGPPMLFESMIFGGPHGNRPEQCSTWAEAKALHAKMLALASAAVPKRRRLWFPLFGWMWRDE